ncbi:cdc42 effector protein 2-like [Pristis pectinata]|uniref:cdc42 effector protein 2-like n=1 Tax=Pristis pectinata TaxID=685728 RepID=UPI00223E7DD9|nr:cdc42 effector protein 2-like [Pristis pectinata]XP_051876486.1 cdc42 effector protein 2-like [Pristis pectinata]XP_051876495.1 cdc42 effector protein 2-like [Pristis pectinata]XP_051876502.1 cdc42 effector protein 2-like [Pristis pectinata]
MSLKTPIYLKTALPKKGKKPKLREVLSADMISPPLGDFHHKSHIGRRGESDTFGDMSFLQGQDELLSSLSTSKDPRGVAPPKPPRLHLGESDDTTTVNPTQAASKSPDNQLPTLHSPYFQYHMLKGSKEAPPHDKQIDDKDQQQTEGVEGWLCSAERTVDESQSNPSESMFSFELDLGPSILEDVLKIMDNHKSVTSQQ